MYLKAEGVHLSVSKASFASLAAPYQLFGGPRRRTQAVGHRVSTVDRTRFAGGCPVYSIRGEDGTERVYGWMRIGDGDIRKVDKTAVDQWVRNMKVSSDDVRSPSSPSCLTRTFSDLPEGSEYSHS